MPLIWSRTLEIVHFEVRDTYLFVKGKGAFTIDGALRGFQQVVELSSKHQRQRILADLCDVTGDQNVLSLYEVGVQMPKYWKGIHCFAILNRPEQILPDRFWQNVTRNQGLNTGVFDNLPEAIAWLEKHAD
jgi:hypothetical protein